MPERARYFLWRQNDRIIAFSLAFVHDDTITMNVSAWIQRRPRTFS